MEGRRTVSSLTKNKSGVFEKAVRLTTKFRVNKNEKKKNQKGLLIFFFIFIGEAKIIYHFL